MNRISGCKWAATANARRTVIPDEYLFTGVSMNFSTSANATISSNERATALGHAQNRAIEKDVFATGQLGVKTGADLEQAGHPSLDLDTSRRRIRNSRENLEQRALAGAVSADDADDLPRPDVEGNVTQGPKQAVPTDLRGQGSRAMVRLDRRSNRDVVRSTSSRSESACVTPKRKLLPRF